MALFGSSKSTTPSNQKIRPTVVRTQNVAKELLSIAKSFDVKPESVDFNLLDVETFTRMNDGTKETDWELIAPNELYELDDESALLNPHFQIKQMYEIEMFSRHIADDPFRDFSIAVGANATKCKVYLSIKAGSKVSYFPNFERELLMLVNRKKIRAGILINIFDEMMSDALSKIAANVRVNEHVVYEQNETILIAESYEPTPTIDDALVLHYDKHEEIDENERVDYSQRGFIKAVRKDELLFEYIKAQEGKAGRNCRGEYMMPKEPTVTHMPTFGVDSTIKVIEDETHIEYRAIENGYVAFENKRYLIKTDIDIKEISFKTTGSIATSLESDVTINVKEKDALKDAVGTGMEVEVSEIDVEGNVGSHARIRALKAKVQGQTHKTSTIRADSLDINIHKGNAYGKHITITRLEHGVVDGDIVEISQALGGEIRAKEVLIELCGSYVKATSSKIIEIKKMHGSENIFTIDPLLKKDARQGFGDNEEQLKVLENELKELQKELEKYTKLVNENMAAYNDVKKRLVHYKKNGVKMPESFVKQYKQFKALQERLDEIKLTADQKKERHKSLASKTATFQENIFNARVINRDRWVGHNEIIFKLIEPPIEVKYSPPEGSSGRVFGLVQVEEGVFEIQVVDE
ncbi:MAG: DUF342 domain-containing protein [Epsilonproteobacteria bacterium]|nr:DUF342 domain-containing protein [Campylobacterota bacterium]